MLFIVCLCTHVHMYAECRSLNLKIFTQKQITLYKVYRITSVFLERKNGDVYILGSGLEITGSAKGN